MTGSIDVADELRDLPLLDLAADLARRHDLFAVENVDLNALVPDLHGLTCRRGRDVLILLDVDNMKRRGSNVERIWAHELGHVIDHLDGRVTTATTRRSVRRREDFADRLGGMLLEHHPRSLSEARPLIAMARSRRFCCVSDPT